MQPAPLSKGMTHLALLRSLGLAARLARGDMELVVDLFDAGHCLGQVCH